jgi:hypothetical protein
VLGSRNHHSTVSTEQALARIRALRPQALLCQLPTGRISEFKPLVHKYSLARMRVVVRERVVTM